MKIAKRVFLFVLTNVLIIATISLVVSLLGLQPYLNTKGINYQSLVIFCIIWGFGGAFISLLLSKIIAKWTMGVKIIDPQIQDIHLQRLVGQVYQFSRQAGLTKMPEVGYYESDEINAFATGPTKNNSLVAVSTGLLQKMTENEIKGVLAHEVAHIANGDMVTMTVLQGIINAFVMFIARLIGFFASQFFDDDKKSVVQFGIVILSEILLGFLGMLVVSFFSRHREYRADLGGAQLSSSKDMIAALEKLKLNVMAEQERGAAAFAIMKISGKKGSWLKWFSTHPDLDDRIAALKRS